MLQNKKPKVLFNILLLVVFSLSIFLPALNYISAEGEEVIEEDYSITVKAEFSSQRVSGMSFDISGQGVADTKPSSSSEDTVFDGLSTGEFKVSITFPENSEYELASGTKVRTVNLSSTNQEESVTFALQKKAPKVDDNLEQIKGFKYPAKLTKVGSTTTDFTKLSPEELANIDNFTLDNPGLNKIVYQEGLNLENFNEYKNIANIGDYIDLDTAGKVRFDTDLLSTFDKSARISMSKVKLVDFEVDGEVSEDIALINRDGDLFTDVTNMTYEGDTLSFSVPGFSTYTITPRVSVTVKDMQPEVTEEEALNARYETETQEHELIINVDNLDAKITVTNGGEIVNFDSELDDNGQLIVPIVLEEGENKFKIEAKLDNGESDSKILTVNFTGEDTSNNSASQFFTIAIIVLIILGAAGAGGYYYYRTRKIKKSTSGKNQGSMTDRDEMKPEKPKYEEGLLTQEERDLYNGDNEEEEEKADEQPKSSNEDEVSDDVDKPTAPEDDKKENS